MSPDMKSLRFEPGRFGIPGIRIEIAETEGKNYIRKPGSPTVYVEDDSDGYDCVGCGAQIEDLRFNCEVISHTADFSRPKICELSIPFCPRCEEAPSTDYIVMGRVGVRLG